MSDWPRLMNVTPVVIVEGEERTRLRTGQTCMCMPAYVTDGDALGDDAVFLYAPAGHQPSETVVTIRADELAGLRAENETTSAMLHAERTENKQLRARIAELEAQVARGGEGT